jgi:hypothetical protein
MKLIKTEDDEQAALFQYASYQKEIEWTLLFAIPNGGYRKIKTGIQLKRTGLKPGIPDIFLPVGRGIYHGLFIEMKSEKGTVRKNQKEWHDALRTQGYKVEVCRGCDQAIKEIQEYLKLWNGDKMCI